MSEVASKLMVLLLAAWSTTRMDYFTAAILARQSHVALASALQTSAPCSMLRQREERWALADLCIILCLLKASDCLRKVW